MVAPHALIRLLLPALRAATGRVLTLSSDAAVEAYPGWGGYGASKAALDQLAAVLGAEEPLLLVYAVDPGDMRTAMHQAAFPGEDISDRPEPETVVPALRRLVDGDLPSGRYEAAPARAGRPAGAGDERAGRGPGVGMTAARCRRSRASPRGAPATTRRRRAGSPATASGCWSPRRPRDCTRPWSASCRRCCGPATSSCSTPPTRCRRRCAG